MFEPPSAEKNTSGGFADRLPPFGPGQMLGTSVLGERGQVVIPVEARRELGLESGDRFVVFGNKYNGMLFFIKSDTFNSMADFFFSQSAMFERIGHSIRDQAGEVEAGSTDRESSPSSESSPERVDSPAHEGSLDKTDSPISKDSPDKADSPDCKDSLNA